MSNDPTLERYSRQMRFGGILEKGQRKLLASRVTLCGCGALGTVIANALVRAGVGFVRIVDRDFIENHNLDRKSTRLNSSHVSISYAVFCLKKKKYNIMSLMFVV